MRIRKRPIPLPFSSSSSLSPLPLSDPLLHRTPVVQLHLTGDISPPKSSIPPPNLSHAWDSVDDSEKINALEKKKKLQLVDDEDEEEKCNDSRERSIIFSAERSKGSLLESSSSSSKVIGRWCEREKAFPLKKRRGSFERWENEEMDTNVSLLEKEKKMMKTKMNKKCSMQKQEDEEEEEPKLGNEDHVNSRGGGGKKRSRGGALMEGSRCSRVNGRGWRCCQQTLVGYSLCEHHLGKGRLRSMNSVRSRSSAATIAQKKESHHGPPSSPLSQEKDRKIETTDTVEEDDDNKKKALMMVTTKKRMKLGVVKARSMSSLLGQIDNVAATVTPRQDDDINK